MYKIEIEYQTPKDIFVLFCALNAMGYNNENNTKGMHPIRRKIRKILFQCNWSQKYPKLKKILNKYHQGSFLAELLSKPLKTKNNTRDTKNRTSKIFHSNLKFFSKEPIIKNLWLIFKNYQIREAKKLFPLFKKEIEKLIKFINQPVAYPKKIVLVPNLLDAYWSGYGFKINKVGYVIVGPGALKNQARLITHELLHVLAPKYRIPKNIFNFDKIINKKLISMGYGGKEILKQEYLVRGLNILYDAQFFKKDIKTMIKKERKEFPEIEKIIGFIENKLKRKECL